MDTYLTFGLSHLAIRVRDLEATQSFYQNVFGMIEMYRTPDFVQLTTPGSRDILVFEQDDNDMIGKTGGIVHFGFRLRKPDNLEEIERRVYEAGGSITHKGAFTSEEPYIFFKDPDGYEIEVWYESLNDYF